MLKIILNNYFRKVPVETLVNISESNSTLLSEVSTLYQNIKWDFFSTSNDRREKLDLDKVFRIENPELLPLPLSPSRSSRSAKPKMEISNKKVEIPLSKEKPKSKIVEERIPKKETLHVGLRILDKNLTFLDPQGIAGLLPDIHVKNLFLLFVKTLGVSTSIIASNYYRTVEWIKNKWGVEKKSDQIAKQTIARWRAKIVSKKLKQKHVLPSSYFEQVKPYVSDPFSRKDLSKSPFGNTDVYLLTDVVLKKSGNKSYKRFVQMKNARDLCEKNSYKNLVIPKAKVYNKFIIEEKLPIIMDSHWDKQQIALYTENKDKFTEAVKEFTGFLYQSTLSDFVRVSSPFYYHNAKIGRYDNIPLYLEEEEGKIGLIDLETFIPTNTCLEKKSYGKCTDAISLFPYHLDEIIEVAKTFDPTIIQHRKKLEGQREETLQAFKRIYGKHLDFIKEKGISIENPFKKIELTSTARGRIINSLNADIDTNHPYITPTDVKKLKENSSSILDIILTFLSESLSSKNTENIVSFFDIPIHRTIQIDSNSKKTLSHQLGKALGLCENSRTLSLWHQDCINLLVDVVISSLEKEKVIQYFCENGKNGYCLHL